MNPLAERLAERIRRRGPIPFPEFMEAALYDPEHGYYARGPDIGAGGDFYTAANLPGFARCVARQAAEMWALLGEPTDFRFVELGPGTGRFARDFLAAAEAEAPGFRAVAEYVAVDPSAGLRERASGAGVRVAGSLDGAFDAPVTGVVFANEVFDALPVHRVRGADDGLEELYVGLDGDGDLAWTPGPPSTPRLAAWLDAGGVALEPGQVAEVCLAAEGLLDDVARHLHRGYLVAIDYGDAAEALYHPARGDTLRAFTGHRVTGAVLEAPGTRDVTASVDFTALQRLAGARGFRTGLASQGDFLVSLGVLDVHREMGPVAGAGVKNLILPGAMGERFKVLVGARGAPLEGVTGLEPPYGSGAPWERPG